MVINPPTADIISTTRPIRIQANTPPIKKQTIKEDEFEEIRKKPKLNLGGF